MYWLMLVFVNIALGLVIFQLEQVRRVIGVDIDVVWLNYNPFGGPAHQPHSLRTYLGDP